MWVQSTGGAGGRFQAVCTISGAPPGLHTVGAGVNMEERPVTLKHYEEGLGDPQGLQSTLRTADNHYLKCICQPILLAKKRGRERSVTWRKTGFTPESSFYKTIAVHQIVKSWVRDSCQT